jgi:Cys-rich protein (TIGR01571 family)
MTPAGAMARYVHHLRLFGGVELTCLVAQCCAWYALSCIGGQCILQCLNRGSTREKYGIEGSTFGDCCASCWCGCCTLIQEEKEAVSCLT